MKSKSPLTSSHLSLFRLGLIGLGLLLSLVSRRTKSSNDFDSQVALAYDRAMRS